MAATIDFALSAQVISALETVSVPGGVQPGSLVFTITLSEPSPDAVTVNWRTLAGTALEGSDYAAFPPNAGTVTFAPNETLKTVTISAIHNTVAEVDKALVLELFDPAGAVLAGNAKVLRQTGFILDDDGVGLKRGLFVSSPVLVEGDGGTRLAEFEVSISRPSDTPISFNWRTKDGSAMAGEDYTARSGRITFAAGETVTTVKVPVTGDRAVELSEFFHLVVTPTAKLADGGAGAVGTATILDDDAGRALPTISVAAQNALETVSVPGGVQPGSLVFTITLSEPSLDAVTVNWRTLAGTALEGSDYAAFPPNAGTVTFAPGETLKTVTISAIHNAVAEVDKALVLELFDPLGAAFAGSAKVLRETAFILDDDGVNLKRSVFVSSPQLFERDSGLVEAVFLVEISRPFTEATALRYATVDGSAKAGQDYLAKTGQITFAPGETEAAVRVRVLADFLAEAPETFGLRLTGAIPASLIAPDAGKRGTATIFDNDLRGTNGADRLTGTNAPEGIHGLGGNDLLFGNGGSDRLYGGAGNDRLNGGAQADVMEGGLGNDRYFVDVAADRVVELANAGTDTVEAFASYILPTHVENLTLRGARDINGTGNALGNVLRGNAGENILRGQDGNDVLFGGGGPDRLIGGADADRFVFLPSDTGLGAERAGIVDFGVGPDRIVLSAIDADRTTGGNQAFDFIGGQGFHGEAGELRYVNGVLHADTNGDRAADFQIAILNSAVLTEDSFIL
ncbi:MAG TPA: Calx-beta domain-containing protein [Paracoccaceae bacterium]|nr:Calx-beta domain-containing protein [Paracoccaceae bacterium]